jgi:phosphoribosylanthranilate isomerase
VPVAIKFCGLTRAEDAAHAVTLGAAYLGVIFAGGPRMLDTRRAQETLAPARGTAARAIGVFGAQSPDDIARTAERAGLEVIQLHADPTAEEIRRVKRLTGCDVWAVARVEGSAPPTTIDVLFEAADGVLLDSRVRGALGGSGRTFDWTAVAEYIAPMRDVRHVILAGGLTPHNVEDGIRALHPDVVDVSSGVEARVGEKDHALMTAFARAAWSQS